MSLKKITASVEAKTVVRLIVLLIALANLVLSVFSTYQIPGLSPETQDALAILITVVASLVSYWYNNSWSKNATTADKLISVLKEADVTVDEVIDVVDHLQEVVEGRKHSSGGTPAT